MKSSTICSLVMRWTGQVAQRQLEGYMKNGGKP